MNNMAKRKKKPLGRKKGTTPRKTSLWKGPVEDGLTQSLLSRWICCRERARLYMVEGWREDGGFNEPLEFGNFWHEAEEAHNGGRKWLPPMQKYRDKLREEHGGGSEDLIRKWYSVARYTFPAYLKYWSTHSDEINRTPIFEEAAFRVPYTLPSGRRLTLRGKFDCVFRSGKSVYLQEHKTKTRVDEIGITKTVDRNLQTMIYQLALHRFKAGHGTIDGWSDAKVAKAREGLQKYRIKGVLYNVIRRPLGDMRSIKQRKGRMVKGKRVGAETEKEFYTRMVEKIMEEPREYFMRWKVILTKQDMDAFLERTLHPVMETFMDWWQSIEEDPFNPWVTTVAQPMESMVSGRHVERVSVPNPFHFQAPWGVYNSLAGGFRGDFFEYLTDGSTTNLKQVSTLYPELAV